MTEPSRFEEIEKQAGLERQMTSFILQQLGGSIDATRARATWEVYLQSCLDAHGLELVSRALSGAIHYAAEKAGFIRRF